MRKVAQNATTAAALGSTDLQLNSQYLIHLVYLNVADIVYTVPCVNALHST